MNPSSRAVGAGLKPAPTDSSKKRLFVAIALPDEIRSTLQELQTELKRFARDAKWVKPDGIHLTLKFLGYVDVARMDGIVGALTRVAAACPSASIEIRGCGAFPNSRRPNVLWAGVESEQLDGIQAKVEDAMASLDFEKEKRPFSPHLTLARFRDPQGLTPLMLQVDQKKELSLGRFTASTMKLYESILHRQGAEYLVVKEFPLEGTRWT